MDRNLGVKLTGDYTKDIELKCREFVYGSENTGSNESWRLTIEVNTNTSCYDIFFDKGCQSETDWSSSFTFAPWFSTHVHFTLAKLVQKLANTAVAKESASFKSMEKEVTKFMVDVKNNRFNSHDEAVQFINNIMTATLDRINIRNCKENLPSTFFDTVDLRFSKAKLIVPGSLGYSLGRTFKLDGKIHIVIHYKTIEDMCNRYDIKDKREINGYIYTIMVHEYIHAYQLLIDQFTDENEAKIGMTIAAREFNVLTNETLIWAMENLIKEDKIDG